jgi:hypothetical protein
LILKQTGKLPGFPLPKSEGIRSQENWGELKLLLIKRLISHAVRRGFWHLMGCMENLALWRDSCSGGHCGIGIGHNQDIAAKAKGHGRPVDCKTCW